MGITKIESIAIKFQGGLIIYFIPFDDEMTETYSEKYKHEVTISSKGQAICCFPSNYNANISNAVMLLKEQNIT